MAKNLPKILFIIASIVTIAIFLLNFYLVGFGVFGDGLGYYTPLRSLIFDGDFRISDEYEYLANSASKFGGGLRVNDMIPEFSKYTMGMGLVLAPFYVLGHLFTLILNSLGLAIDANGLSWTYELFYCLGSILLGIGGLILAYKTAKIYFSPFSSALAVIGVWFATPLTFYLTLEASMSHSVSQFLISSFLYISLTTSWLNFRKYQILMGLILGLAVLVRPQNLLFAIVPILLSLWQILLLKNQLNQLTINYSNSLIWTKIKKYLIALIWFSCFTLLMLTPQLLVYLSQYGSLTEIPYMVEASERGYETSFHWFQPEIFKVLFSGFRGLFIWHPLILLAIIGLIISPQKVHPLNWILLVAFLLQVYFVASWWSWWQGASFGGRMFCNCSLIFTLGLASLWQNFQHKKWAIYSVAITLFLMVWNGLLVMQYESAMIPPEEPISISQLYQNQLFVIPFFFNHIFKR
jgi:hypothetical protein